MAGSIGTKNTGRAGDVAVNRTTRGQWILNLSASFYFPTLGRKFLIQMKKLLSLLPVLLIFCLPVLAQQSSDKNALTTADYKHAEQFLFYGTAPYIDHGGISPHWIEDGRFWYRDMLPEGSRFILINPREESKKPAFDQQKVAISLSKLTGNTYSANRLPFHLFQFTDEGNAIRFHAVGSRWQCDLNTYKCEKIGERSGSKQYSGKGVVSP